MSTSSDSAAGQPTKEEWRPEKDAGYIRPMVTVVGPVAALTQLGTPPVDEIESDGSRD